MTGPTGAIAEQVHEARRAQTPLRIVGAGSWLTAGAPCAATEQLHVRALRGIVEYEPGDLTLTARAGTTLGELALITGAEGQWLTLDPAGSETATIGATIATGSWGPLASAYGTPRDHVLGCEFVTGAGDVVRAGGRVVKNVAGFDLVRLVTGAWGTLGAITEVTVRLRALPEVDRTVAVGIADGAAGVERAWQWLRHSEFAPLAAELLSPSLARRLALGTDATLLLRLGGNAALLRAAEQSVHALGNVTVVNPQCWRTLADADPDSTTVLRISTLPSRMAALWSQAVATVEQRGGFARATLLRGVMRCVVPSSDTAANDLCVLAAEEDVTFIGERMPAALWRAVARPRSSDELSARVRQAFDPDGILNPGILGLPT